MTCWILSSKGLTLGSQLPLVSLFLLSAQIVITAITPESATKCLHGTYDIVVIFLFTPMDRLIFSVQLQWMAAMKSFYIF